MKEFVVGSMSSAADVLKREVGVSLNSPQAAQHVLLASEDIAPLAIQLMFTSTQKNGPTLLGQHMDIVGNIGFMGAASHFATMMLQDSQNNFLGPVSPGCIAHYVDWLGRSHHAKSRLNGKTFNALVDSMHDRKLDRVEDPHLASNLATTFKQIDQHKRLDRTHRQAMLKELATSDDALFRLGAHVKRMIILTGEGTTPEEYALFNALTDHVESVLWISCAKQDEADGRFHRVSDGSAELCPVTGMYASLKASQDEAQNGVEGIYLHQNHIGTFSQLFGLTLSMIAASLDLGHRIEWYTVLRGILRLPHEDAVSMIQKLGPYRDRDLPVDGVNENIGRNNVVGKTFVTCYNFADSPESAYRTAFTEIKKALEARGMSFDGENSKLINDIHLYYRWMSRVARDTHEFYLMACLYPYSGRYPKQKIYLNTQK